MGNPRLSIPIFLSLLFRQSSGVVPTERFLPFGVEHKDAQVPRMDDGSVGPIVLNPPSFPFFNDTYTSLFVNVNGAISFRKGIGQFNPTCSALPRDSAMIAPYWTDVDLTHTGHIYYRQSNLSSDLDHASSAIRHVYPSTTYSLSLKWVFITTWVNVTFFKPCGTPYPTNTFQSILATDGVVSYAIFYYNRLVWTTGRHDSSRGDCAGLGGVGQAKAGFDTGDGATFHQIRFSCSADVLRLGNESNIGRAGVWLFKIDNHFEDASSCNDVTKEIKISPGFVSSSGQDLIEIRGPCLSNVTHINVTFTDKVGFQVGPVVPVGINEKDSVIFVVIPKLDEVQKGRILVQLEVSRISGNNSIRTLFTGQVYTKRYHPSVIISTEEPVTSGNGSRHLPIQLSWAPTNYPDSEQVTLLTIAVNEANASKILTNTTFPNTGRYSGSLNITSIPLELVGFEPVSSYRIILVPSQTQPFTSRVRRSAPNWMSRLAFNAWKYTLGYPVRKTAAALACTGNLWDILSLKDPAASARARCDSFHASDPGLPVNTPGLEPCPSTTSLAFADDLRFEQDGSRWGVDHEKFHPGHAHTFRQKHPTPSGARNQCVYDPAGKLMTTGRGRGTVDAGSGFDEHRDLDVLPWCDCCDYSKSETYCDKYFDKRPSKDDTGYKAPRTGRSVGDPHFVTFSSKSYMFNGKGEFWLIQESSNFSVQGRMEPLGSGSASIFTAVVLSSARERVQVEIGPGSELDVLLDGELVPFREIGEEIEGESVIVTKSRGGQVTVSFGLGFSFTFSRGGRSLNFVAGTSSTQKITGLLGNSPLTSRNSSVLSTNATAKEIHYDFGLSWLVHENETLFTYKPDKNYSSYCDPDFKPYFEQPTDRTGPLWVSGQQLCGNSSECLFDFWASSGDTELANATKLGAQVFAEKENILKERRTEEKLLMEVMTTTPPSMPRMTAIPFRIKSLKLWNLPKMDIGTAFAFGPEEWQYPDSKFRIYLKKFGTSSALFSDYVYIWDSFDSLTRFNQQNASWDFYLEERWPQDYYTLPYFINVPFSSNQKLRIQFWDVDSGLHESICVVDFPLDGILSQTPPPTLETPVESNLTCRENATASIQLYIPHLTAEEDDMSQYFQRLEGFLIQGFPTPGPTPRSSTTTTAPTTRKPTTTEQVVTIAMTTTTEQIPRQEFEPLQSEAKNLSTTASSSVATRKYVAVRIGIDIINFPRHDEGLLKHWEWPDPYLKIFLKGYRPLFWREGAQLDGDVVNKFLFLVRTARYFDKVNASWELSVAIPFFYEDTEQKQILNVEVWDEDIQFDDKMYDVNTDLRTLFNPEGLLHKNYSTYTQQSPARIENKACCGAATFIVRGYLETSSEVAGFPKGFP